MQQRVTVGNRLGDEVVTDNAIGTGPVIDDKGMPNLLFDLTGNGARGCILCATGCGRHDKTDGTARVRIRANGNAAGDGKCC